MRNLPALQAHADVRRARRDHASKEWLRSEECRAMQMLVGCVALAVLVILGALLGVAGADWWTGGDTIVDLVADLRAGRVSLGGLLTALQVAP